MIKTTIYNPARSPTFELSRQTMSSGNCLQKRQPFKTPFTRCIYETLPAQNEHGLKLFTRCRIDVSIVMSVSYWNFTLISVGNIFITNKMFLSYRNETPTVACSRRVERVEFRYSFMIQTFTVSIPVSNLITVSVTVSISYG